MTPQILLDAFKLKPAAAVAFLKRKGMTFSWKWTDTWQEAHNNAFTVAKAMRLDVLQDIRDMVQKAIDEGITFETFKKELQPRLEEKGWWGKKWIGGGEGAAQEVQLGSVRRLKTIFDTNLQTSYMAGRRQGQLATIETMPYWEYIHPPIAKVPRPEHAALNGVVLPAADPFWQTHYPPNGWGCHCHVRARSQRDINRTDTTVSSSSGKMVEKSVMVDGREEKVSGYKTPGGTVAWTEPGWSYAPGEKQKIDFKKYDPDIAEIGKE
jgi:uncharacterized protein with gpF-like domain